MKTFIYIISTFLLLFFMSFSVYATNGNNHTLREETEGKAIWEKLQAKQIACDSLADEDYERLGEYYMGQMVGDSHQAMNTMMERMMGKEGEEQMHVVMGKRLSGCDTSASFPQSGVGFIPMMMGSAFAPWSFGGTKGGGSPMMGYGGMMNWGAGFATFSLFFFLFWILILLNLALLAVFLWKKIKQKK